MRIRQGLLFSPGWPWELTRYPSLASNSWQFSYVSSSAPKYLDYRPEPPHTATTQKYHGIKHGAAVKMGINI